MHLEVHPFSLDFPICFWGKSSWFSRFNWYQFYCLLFSCQILLNWVFSWFLLVNFAKGFSILVGFFFFEDYSLHFISTFLFFNFSFIDLFFCRDQNYLILFTSLGLGFSCFANVLKCISNFIMWTLRAIVSYGFLSCLLSYCIVCL